MLQSQVEFFGRRIDMHKCTPNSPNPSRNDKLQYKVFVGGLDASFTEDMIRMALSPFGEVLKVNIIRQQDGRSRGFAFVHFAEQEAVDQLIQRQHMNINGRKVCFGSATVKKNKNAPSTWGKRGRGA